MPRIQLLAGGPPLDVNFGPDPVSVLNTGPGLLTYADNEGVSLAPEGTIAAGATATLSGTQWFIADALGGTLVFPPAAASGGSGVSQAALDLVGSRAAREEGNNNFFLGTTAGVAVTSASQNLMAIGRDALKSATTAQLVTAIGWGALENLVGSAPNLGIASTAIGTDAFQGTTEGHHNVGVGHGVGRRIITGSGNTLMGVYAGSAFDDDDPTSVSTAPVLSSCTLIGYYAGRQVRMDGATAVGFNALGSARTVSGGTAMGLFALGYTTAGNNQTAVGDNALYNSQGEGNTALGMQAGAQNSTGVGNTFIGKSSGLFTQDFQFHDGSVHYCTLLGSNTIATASYMVVLGGNHAADRSSVVIGGVGSAANVGNGRGVLSMWNATTTPTADHANGALMYPTAGRWKWRHAAPSVPTAATDAATTQALVNALRTELIGMGILS